MREARRRSSGRMTPTPGQIATCRMWLRANGHATKRVCRTYGAYWYKHAVEAQAGVYIPCEAFIAAAQLEGFRVERFNRLLSNAHFNFTLNRGYWRRFENPAFRRVG